MANSQVDGVCCGRLFTQFAQSMVADGLGELVEFIFDLLGTILANKQGVM